MVNESTVQDQSQAACSHQVRQYEVEVEDQSQATSSRQVIRDQLEVQDEIRRSENISVLFPQVSTSCICDAYLMCLNVCLCS